MKRLLALCLALVPAAGSAVPLYGVTWELREDATRKKEECDKGAEATLVRSSTVFDYCACTAHIVYPQMMGLGEEPQKAINQALRSQVDDEGCGGGPTYKPQAGRTGDRVQTRFDVSYAGERLISFLLWHDSYSAGAAHNLWSAEGSTFDVKTGRKLSLSDLVAPAKLAEVNAKISSSLAAAYPGHDMPAPEAPLASAESKQDAKAAMAKEHDEPTVDAANATVPPSASSETRAGATSANEYLSPDGCKGCTYHLTPEGLEIVFQLYEVASFAEGNPKVTIGREYLKPEISEAM